MKSFFKTATKKQKIIIVSAIFLVALLIFGIHKIFFAKKDAATAVEYEPYTVQKGDLTVSITGSGTVEPIEQYEIQSIVTGDILEDYVTVGTDVKKDDILYIVDSESIENNLERTRSSYEQQLISHGDRVDEHNKTLKKRNVKAPSAGVISELYVENGDSVNAGTKLAEIKNTYNLSVNIPFLEANAKKIKLNQSATVFFDDRNESITGYVSHVATGTYATDSGAIVSDVEITFNNPGAIMPGETVTAITGGFACNDFGTVEAADSKIIVAEVSGDIKNLKYSKGDKIAANAPLLTIYDEASDSAVRTSELSLKNAELSLQDMEDKLDDYTIKSPITGTIIDKTMKAGDTLDGNKSSLAIVADMSKLTFDISVDELDIKDISIGQSVIVTADALPNREFKGVVDTISIIGTTTSGVTVYPVTIVISEYEGLLPGMNVNAEIVTGSASDVLLIPSNAVTRGNYVLVKDDSDIEGINDIRDSAGKGGKKDETNKQKSASGKKSDSKSFLPEAPEGYKYVKVSLGISNDDFVEVTDGLREKDVIYVTVIRNTSTSAGMFGMSSGMPSGGMGRGMPSGGMGSTSGGMPTGGMSSGRTGAYRSGGMQ